jgi:hypothetical protein
LERLEFSGVRDGDGKLSGPFDDQGYEDWPETIEVKAACGAIVVKFRLEETDDGVTLNVDDPDRVSVAWYVPDDGTSKGDQE